MDFHIVCLLFLIPFCKGQSTTVAPVEDAAVDAAASVTFEVSITGDLDKISMDIGAQFIMACMGTEQDVTLKWYKDDVEVTNQDENAGTYSKTSGNKQLIGNKNLLDSDGGFYRCEGELGGVTADDTKELIIKVPITTDAPEEQWGLQGTDAKVKCAVTGNPAPTVTWTMDGNTLDSSDKYKIEADHLLIKNVEAADEQTYVCGITEFTSFFSKDISIKFEVVVAPSIDMAPAISPDHPKEGDEVTLSCTANGKPAPTYQWFKGQNIIEASDSISIEGNLLTLKKVLMTDEATYMCKASNKGGSANMSNTLDIKVPPTIETAPDDIQTKEGEDRTIECVARGDPMPSVRWERVDFTPSDTYKVPDQTTSDMPVDNVKDLIEVTATLTLSPVSYAYAGQWKCIATSNQGSAEQLMSLGVEYAPNFDTDYKQTEFLGWAGHTSVMSCKTSANPQATIDWYEENPAAPGDTVQAIQINSDSGIKYKLGVQDNDNKPFSTSTLSIAVNTDDVPAAFKKYYCKANNYINSSWHEMTLKQAFPPAVPSTSQKEVLASQIILSVSPPAENGGLEVTGYEWKVDQGVKGSGSINVGEDIIISDLESATQYTIEVAARNDVGVGSFQSIVLETESISKPIKPSVTSGAEAESNKYVLTWEKIQDGGDAITKLTIIYQKVETAEDGTVNDFIGEEVTKELSDINMLEYTLENLDASSQYDVRISATNNQGVSTPGRILITTAPKYQPSSASLGGGIIAVIIILLLVVIVVIVIVVFVVRKKPELVNRLRKRGNAGGEEGVKEGGKDPAEEEKLIKKDDTVKVENEVEDGGNPPVIEVNQEEFEPETKPVTPDPTPEVVDTLVSPDPAPGTDAPTEVTVTPTTPETSPDNPQA